MWEQEMFQKSDAKTFLESSVSKNQAWLAVKQEAMKRKLDGKYKECTGFVFG